MQDDESVLRQKGNYPVIPLLDRMKIIRALRGVDKVISYSDVYQADLLEKNKIDCLVVSTTYGESDEGQKRTVKYCKDKNITVFRLKPLENISTTLIKEKIHGN